MLKPICAKKSAAKISCDHNEDVVDFLGEDKEVDLETSGTSYQDLQKMSQSTARSGLPVVIVIYQTTHND